MDIRLCGSIQMIIWRHERFCCRHPSCPEVTAQLLFKAMAYCKDVGLAHQAFTALCTICGFEDAASMSGIHELPSYGMQACLQVVTSTH